MNRQDALDYHANPRPGKIAVVPTKPLNNQRDLALAYSPGVAEPCLEIHKNPSEAYRYTARGNLVVAVVTNGTAVLGLGNIGALAGKPVMEGKGNLFKQFSDIDVFDLEVGSENPDDVIRFCQLLEPTVGGINLEDIKAPECFYIEETLRKTMKIPVFHDDQHGTAIISGAALLNALEVVGKNIAEVRVVFSGAGASAIATATHYVRLGVKREHIIMCDKAGVIYAGRADHMDPYKATFANETSTRTLAEALVNADVFVGLSAAGAMTQEMVKVMAKDPVIFALANPVPEILPEEVKAVRDDAIVATGRSDYPNQVNNVLGFPFILPRRAGRARHDGERGDEDGGHARPCRAGQGRRPPTRSRRCTDCARSSSGASTSSPSRSTRARCSGWRRPSRGPPWPAAWRRSSSRSTNTASSWKRVSAAPRGSCAASSTVRCATRSGSCFPRERRAR